MKNLQQKLTVRRRKRFLVQLQRYLENYVKQPAARSVEKNRR